MFDSTRKPRRQSETDAGFTLLCSEPGVRDRAWPGPWWVEAIQRTPNLNSILPSSTKGMNASEAKFHHQ